MKRRPEESDWHRAFSHRPDAYGHKEIYWRRPARVVLLFILLLIAITIVEAIAKSLAL